MRIFDGFMKFLVFFLEVVDLEFGFLILFSFIYEIRFVECLFLMDVVFCLEEIIDCIVCFSYLVKVRLS